MGLRIADGDHHDLPQELAFAPVEVYSEFDLQPAPVNPWVGFYPSAADLFDFAQQEGGIRGFLYGRGDWLVSIIRTPSTLTAAFDHIEGEKRADVLFRPYFEAIGPICAALC